MDKEKLKRFIEIAKKNGLGKSDYTNSITTNWIVFTGTFSAGKTTLVKDVAESLGVHFHQEPARVFIEKQLQSGRTNSEIWADVASTVMPIHSLRVDLESSLNPQQILILDTAIPDTLPYALLYGVNPHDIIKASHIYRYKEPIFLVEPLAFQTDEVRNSNTQERMALHYLRKKIYMTLGYSIVSIPVLDRIGRRDFVHRCLDERQKNCK